MTQFHSDDFHATVQFVEFARRSIPVGAYALQGFFFRGSAIPTDWEYANKVDCQHHHRTKTAKSGYQLPARN